MFARSALLSTLSAAALRRQKRFLRCLYCHHVFDDQRAAFRDLLRRLSADAKFVDSDTCLAMAKGNIAIDGRYLHLSFDDGLANIVTNATPILAELRIPAIFFVPTALIDSDYSRTERYFAGGSEYAGALRFATWAELAQTAAAGVEIGSHTRNHVRLSAISEESTLVDEVAGSKRDIEEKLGRSCRYISWPFGRQGDISEAALRAIRESGYEGCFGAFRGRVVPARTSLLQVPRHHFEVDWPLRHVEYFAEGHREPQ